MRLFQSALTIRGDSLYCPLSLSLDSYWNCQANCHHCSFRRLNYVWGRDLRPLDVENFNRRLVNGLKNNNPKSSLAWAIKKKKTIRFGSKSDPFQPAENTYGVSGQALKILIDLRWTLMIQTMFTENMAVHSDSIIRENKRGGFVAVQPVISPGAELDWEVLEKRRTTPIQERIDYIVGLKREGVPVSVNGEPFIPGYHTVNQFEDVVKRLVSYGIRNYSVYNFHFNDFVAKRLHNIGIDIERIWFHNRDEYWKPILRELIEISKKHNIVLGCPDFVNSGSYVEAVNTCCGMNVPNPTTFNVMTWKKKIINGEEPETAFSESWDNVGDFDLGRKVFEGKEKSMYSLLDCGEMKCYFQK